MYRCIDKRFERPQSLRGSKKLRFQQHRPLRIERLEDRYMLTLMADILIMQDESGSEQNTKTQDWLATVIDDLADAVAVANIDVRYGLIGFGEGEPVPNQETARYAHSQLLGSSGGKHRWTTSSTDLIAAINNDLAESGSGPSEDGWNAIEHAIAEYDFRESAIPIIVLAQGDQGRRVLNDALTHNGVLATLESANAVFNSLVAGTLLLDGQPATGFVSEPIGLDQLGNPLNPQPSIDWAPIFELSKYETAVGDFDDLYILGVESDRADGAAAHKHVYHAFDTVTNAVPGSLPTTESDALQISYNGSNTGATGMVGAGKSIVISQDINAGALALAA